MTESGTQSGSEKRSPSRRDRRHLVVGIAVAPRLLDDVGDRLPEDLGRTLSAKYPSVEWRATVLLDRLVAPTEPAGAILDAAREALLAGGWDMGLVVTDLPLRERGRPVAHRTSRTHRIAVVSLPALGALHVKPRLRRLLLELVGELIGGGDGHGVLGEISRRVASRPAGFSVLFIPAVVLGHVRLLAGMVRANRPWRLAARLYGALVAALAAGAYGVVTSDIWRLSAAMGWERLSLMCVTSIVATVVAVIVVHELWERAPQRSVRAQVVLFNLATAATVAIGIVTLYLTLLVLIFAGAELIIARRVLAETLGHQVDNGDYVVLAWFVASLATVGGALGAGLESDEAVREAAYAGSRGTDERPAG
ncbi:MAG: hypothetical protein JOZ99_12990 [Actinobacteria bacterium]|nr:hypothetical protein [Actinomycetota bacterium]